MIPISVLDSHNGRMMQNVPLAKAHNLDEYVSPLVLLQEQGKETYMVMTTQKV